MRKLVLAAGCALAAALPTLPSHAADAWPDHTITFVVPFAPGGAIDLVGRIYAKKIAEILKQDIVVENRPGAGSMVGATHVAHSKPDGYTFLVGGNGIPTNTLIRSDQPYRDDELTPIGMLGTVPSIIVTNPANPANDLKEFVANAKAAKLDHVAFSTAGVGSTPDFVGAMVKQQTGLPIDIIPYKSGAEGVTAVVGGQTMMTSEASIVTLPLIKGGQLKALATTSDHKLASAPQIRTTAEEGYPEIRISHWEGLFGRTGTPEAVLERMNAAIREASQSPDVLDALARASIEPGTLTRPEFTKYVADERARLAKVVTEGHMHAN
jgi:tripartite-type tricarboxylate transporter receptor subunit TctC